MKAKATKLSLQNSCHICATPSPSYWALSECGHSYCSLCCLRMRILYKNKKCPLCNKDSGTKTIILRHPQNFSFSTLLNNSNKNSNRATTTTYDEGLSLYFESEDVRKKSLQPSTIKCPMCYISFDTISVLKEHLSSIHNGFIFCEVCLSNKKVFPQEQRLFASKEDLLTHQRGNEPDSHSFCHICKKIFYSDEELDGHNRLCHEQCHICSKINQRRLQNTIPDRRKVSKGDPRLLRWYKGYSELAVHFEKEHHPCMEEVCLGMKFVIFEEPLELQAHLSQVHGVRSNRPIKLDIPFYNQSHTPLPTGPSGGRGGGNGFSSSSSSNNNRNIVIGLNSGNRGNSNTINNASSNTNNTGSNTNNTGSNTSSSSTAKGSTSSTNRDEIVKNIKLSYRWMDDALLKQVLLDLDHYISGKKKTLSSKKGYGIGAPQWGSSKMVGALDIVIALENGITKRLSAAVASAETPKILRDISLRLSCLIVDDRKRAEFCLVLDGHLKKLASFPSLSSVGSGSSNGAAFSATSTTANTTNTTNTANSKIQPRTIKLVSTARTSNKDVLLGRSFGHGTRRFVSTGGGGASTNSNSTNNNNNNSSTNSNNNNNSSKMLPSDRIVENENEIEEGENIFLNVRDLSSSLSVGGNSGDHSSTAAADAALKAKSPPKKKGSKKGQVLFKWG